MNSHALQSIRKVVLCVNGQFVAGATERRVVLTNSEYFPIRWSAEIDKANVWSDETATPITEVEL